MTHITGSTKIYEGNRGVALVTSLLILSLFTVMTLSMVIATTSDTLIDGYYRNARGSFYAADSGINAARQALLNQISSNALPAGYTPSAGSPNMVSPATLLTNVTNSSTGFGSYNSVLGTSSSASNSSWAGSFKIDTTKTTFGYVPQPNDCTPAPQCRNGSTVAVTAATPYQYFYAYHLVVDGQSNSGEVNVIEEYGTITYTIKMNPTTTSTTSFAAYGTLFDKYALCSAPFVPGTMSGQMFSNQSWNFGDSSYLGTSTKYVFTGNVGAVNANVGYFYGSDGSCQQSPNPSNTHGGVTINPTFSGGLSLGETAIPMPSDSFNQLSAVLDGLGDCPPAPASCTAPAQAAMAVLTDAHGTSYPASGSLPSSGVFMPYSIVGSTKTLNGNAGGIYVQGSASQVLLSTASVMVSGTPHNEQIIQIKQGTGSSAVTTTVTLDLTGGTTRMTDTAGNDTGPMSGLPQNLNASPATEGCLVYVSGNISSNTSSSTPTGLSGPSSGPAIANNSAVTVVSTGTIDITGDLKYSTEPVSLTTADTPVSPAPTNVLGIYTSGGNVELKPPTAVASMEIDASLAEMSSGASYGMTAQWNSITTLNIVGGRVQNQALSGASLTSRNIYFDKRFIAGFAPPWFPTTTITTTTTNTAVPQPPAALRTSWVNSSAQ
jgi:Tfp pilus assembly protein PilX